MLILWILPETSFWGKKSNGKNHFKRTKNGYDEILENKKSTLFIQHQTIWYNKINLKS